MAAGKSGGSAGKAIFLEGTFVAPPQGEGVEAGVVVVVGGTFATPGVPRAVILSCVLQVGLGPRGSGRSMAGQGNAPRARRVRVRPGRGLGQAGARRAEARGGLRPRKAWTGLPISLFLMIYLFFFPPMAALAGESRLLHSGLAPRSWKVSDGEAWWESADPGRQGRGRELSFPGLPGWKHPRLAAAPGVQVRPESLRRCVW